MLRRRGFMRPMRRAFRGEIPPALQRANALMAKGDYPAAAAAFETLASGAETRLSPRAPSLFLEAGRARMLAGQMEVGLGHLKRGLSLLATTGRSRQVFRIGQGIVSELQTRGLSKEAQEISDYVKTGISSLPQGMNEPFKEGHHPSLPTRCPGCGGPVRPDEVEWLDDATAECSYCGSSLRGEK